MYLMINKEESAAIALAKGDFETGIKILSLETEIIPDTLHAKHRLATPPTTPPVNPFINSHGRDIGLEYIQNPFIIPNSAKILTKWKNWNHVIQDYKEILNNLKNDQDLSRNVTDAIKIALYFRKYLKNYHLRVTARRQEKEPRQGNLKEAPQIATSSVSAVITYYPSPGETQTPSKMRDGDREPTRQSNPNSSECQVNESNEIESIFKSDELEINSGLKNLESHLGIDYLKYFRVFPSSRLNILFDTIRLYNTLIIPQLARIQELTRTETAPLSDGATTFENATDENNNSSSASSGVSSSATLTAPTGTETIEIIPTSENMYISFQTIISSTDAILIPLNLKWISENVHVLGKEWFTFEFMEALNRITLNELFLIGLDGRSLVGSESGIQESGAKSLRSYTPWQNIESLVIIWKQHVNLGGILSKSIISFLTTLCEESTLATPIPPSTILLITTLLLDYTNAATPLPPILINLLAHFDLTFKTLHPLISSYLSALSRLILTDPISFHDLATALFKNYTLPTIGAELIHVFYTLQCSLLDHQEMHGYNFCFVKNSVVGFDADKMVQGGGFGAVLMCLGVVRALEEKERGVGRRKRLKEWLRGWLRGLNPREEVNLRDQLDRKQPDLKQIDEEEIYRWGGVVLVQVFSSSDSDSNTNTVSGATVKEVKSVWGAIVGALGWILGVCERVVANEDTKGLIQEIMGIGKISVVLGELLAVMIGTDDCGEFEFNQIKFLFERMSRLATKTQLGTLNLDENLMELLLFTFLSLVQPIPSSLSRSPSNSHQHHGLLLTPLLLTFSRLNSISIHLNLTAMNHIIFALCVTLLDIVRLQPPLGPGRVYLADTMALLEHERGLDFGGRVFYFRVVEGVLGVLGDCYLRDQVVGGGLGKYDDNVHEALGGENEGAEYLAQIAAYDSIWASIFQTSFQHQELVVNESGGYFSELLERAAVRGKKEGAVIRERVFRIVFWLCRDICGSGNYMGSNINPCLVSNLHTCLQSSHRTFPEWMNISFEIASQMIMNISALIIEKRKQGKEDAVDELALVLIGLIPAVHVVLLDGLLEKIAQIMVGKASAEFENLDGAKMGTTGFESSDSKDSFDIELLPVLGDDSINLWQFLFQTVSDPNRIVYATRTRLVFWYEAVAELGRKRRRRGSMAKL